MINEFFEKQHLEKKIRKYIVAALSYPRTYMYKKPGEMDFKFFEDIEKSTKYLKRKDAEDTILIYQRNTGDVELELLVIPLDIDYYLVEEYKNNQDEVLIDAVVSTDLNDYVYKKDNKSNISF